MNIYIPDTTGINDIDAFINNTAQENFRLNTIINEEQKIIKTGRAANRESKQKQNAAHLQRCVNSVVSQRAMLKKYGGNQNNKNYQREMARYRKESVIGKSLHKKYCEVGAILIEKQDPSLFEKSMNQILLLKHPKKVEDTTLSVVSATPEENAEIVALKNRIAELEQRLVEKDQEIAEEKSINLELAKQLIENGKSS